MKHNKIAYLAALLTLLFGINKGVLAQNFPKLGNDTLLDIACWNIEWFGDATNGNGPNDEETQFANVKALIEKTEMDVFALEEISNATAYANLNAALIAKYESYISSFSQTQKMAIYWRKSMFTFLPNLSYNITVSSGDNYFFASRPPLQVALATKGGTKTDTLYFLCVHLKAFSDVDSYNRRIGASGALKSYVEANLIGKKFVILGDWNDDLDVSTYNNATTPFANLLNAGYTFPSKELTDLGKSSYAFNTNMIDHIMNSKTLDSFYYKNSARVFDAAPNYCPGFSNNTSDHFPVYASYNWQKLTTRVIPEGILGQTEKVRINVYPNPTSGTLFISAAQKIRCIQIWDVSGRMVKEHFYKENETTQTLSIDELTPGVYSIQIQVGESLVCKKLFKE